MLPGWLGVRRAPMDAGATVFRDALFGALSSAVLGLIAPDTATSGLQTFDGATLSALIATLNAPLRESIAAATSLLRAPAVAAHAGEMEAAAAATAAERVDALEAELASATAALEADAEAAPDAEAHEAVAAVKAELAEATAAASVTAAAAAASASKPVARAPRGDAERLRAALEADELRPVRLALGLSVPEALAVEAAASLLRAGVCAGDLAAKGYPVAFVEAMRKAGATLMYRI